MCKSVNESAEQTNLIEKLPSFEENNLIVDSSYADTNDVELHNIHNSFNILHLNIHSLVAKYDELKCLLSDLDQKNNHLDIIMLNETLLNNERLGLVQLTGYELITKNRNSRDGGVAIYINENINYKRRQDLEVDVEREIESVTIEIQTNKRCDNIVVSSLYRIPNTREQHFISKFKQLSKAVIRKKKANHRL